MNEGLNPHQPSVEERIASFARIANILAAFARAGARLRLAAAIRAHANAPAEVLHALEVPARGAPARNRAPVADAVNPHEIDRASSPRNARPLAAVLAAGNPRSAPIAEVHNGRARNEGIAPSGETSERALSSRVATTDALAAVRAGSIAVSRVRQLTLHANLQSGAQDNHRAADGSAISELAISPASRALNVAAMLTASGSIRRTIAADRHAGNLTAAPEAIEPDAQYRGATRTSEAATAIAMLPARIQRVLASSRAAVLSADEFSLRADLADPSRERARDFGVRGGRPSANVAAPITINSSPSITVNLPPGAAAPGESGISRAVAQALEEHAERLYEMMRQVGAFRERTEF